MLIATLNHNLPSLTDNLVTQLENAEKLVKEERDRLNTFNSAIATGSANIPQGSKKHNTKIDTDTLSRTVDSYNAAMKNRQKLENKLFRVVIALGGKVQTFP